MEEKISMTRSNGRVTTPVGSETKTKQSMAEACDVNAIIRRFKSTGSMEHVREAAGVYGDFANVDEYHHALNRVRRAEEHFEGLSARVREKCGNDPAELVDLYTDPDRYEDLVELGLLPPVTNSPVTTDPEPEPAAEPDPES